MISKKFHQSTTWSLRLLLATLFVVTAFFVNAAASETLPPEGMTVADVYAPGEGPAVGRIASVRGEVVIMHAERRTVGYMARKGLPLYEGDALATRKKSRVSVRLNDDSFISLAADTTLVVDKSVYKPAQKERSVLTRMIMGMARFVVRKLANSKRSEFEVRTKTSIAGVRGSDFIVKASDIVTEIITMKDTRLAVSSHAYPDRVTMLSDFQRTTVAAGALPKDPVGVRQGEIDRLKEIFPDQSPAGSRSGASKPKGKIADGQVVHKPGGQGMRDLGKGGASTPASTGSQGSGISGSVVNQATLNNVSNIAEGTESSANMGAVKIKGSKVGGEIDNKSQADDVTNISEGEETESNVGSIIVE
ncbi:MAG: FecR domain-containing protein [Desulfobacterales bacterium]|nr:FecR domain-containing protein [Desulfobacterales bacterium]